MTRIYTRTGDNGTTGLIGGDRVSKDSLRIEAYGTVDELNSFIGLALAHGAHQEISAYLFRIQNELFDVGAELALAETVKTPRIQPDHVLKIEEQIDALSDKLPPLTQFILPGGSKAASYLHVARTVCRRAERQVVSLHSESNINPEIIHYLNRLSDYLFVAARYQNHREQIPDVIWTPDDK